MIAVLFLMALVLAAFVFPIVYIAIECHSGRNPFKKILQRMTKK